MAGLVPAIHVLQNCIMAGGFVYILTNRPNGTLYVGVTNNLVRRIHEHRSGSVDGFRYSRPMHEKHEQNFVWTEDNLRAYIRNPKEVVPNGAMSFPGLRNEQQLNDLLAYLRAQK